MDILTANGEEHTFVWGLLLFRICWSVLLI